MTSEKMGASAVPILCITFIVQENLDFASIFQDFPLSFPALGLENCLSLLFSPFFSFCHLINLSFILIFLRKIRLFVYYLHSFVFSKRYLHCLNSVLCCNQRESLPCHPPLPFHGKWVRRCMAELLLQFYLTYKEAFTYVDSSGSRFHRYYGGSCKSILRCAESSGKT